MLRSFCILGIAVVLFGYCGKAQPEENVIVQQGHTGKLAYAEFNSDSSRLLTVTGRPTYSQPANTILWDTRSGRKLCSFDSKPTRFPPVFVLKGRAVLCGMELFDQRSGRRLRDLAMGESRTGVRRVCDDRQRCLLSNEFGSVRGVHLASGRPFFRWDKDDWYPAMTARGVDRVNVRPSPGDFIHDLRLNARGHVMALFQETTRYKDEYGHSLVSAWNLTTKKKISEREVDIIDSAEFGPDTDYYIIHYWDDTGSSDEETVICRTASGQVVRKTREAAFSDAQLPFTQTGDVCCLGTHSKTAIVLDLESNTERNRFPVTDTIRELRLLDDDNTLEAIIADGSTYRWSMKTGDRLNGFKYPDAWSPEPIYPEMRMAGKRPATGRRFSPDGSVFIGTTGKETCLFPATGGERLAELSTDRNLHHEMKWNRDGTRALTLTDGIWRLWDIANGRLLQSFGYWSTPRVYYGGPQVTFSENGKFVCTYGRLATVFNAVTGQPAAEAPAVFHDGSVPEELGTFYRGGGQGQYHGYGLISADRRMSASWNSADNEASRVITIWDLNVGKILHRLSMPSVELSRHATFSHQNRFFTACAHGPGRTYVWDLKTGERLSDFPVTVDANLSLRSAGSVTFLRDETRFLYVSGSRTVSLVDNINGRVLAELTDSTPAGKGASTPGVRSVMLLSPDERYVVADYGTTYSVVWDLESFQPVLRIDRDTGNAPVTRRLFFSDDSNRLLASGSPCTVWNLETGGHTEVDPWELMRGQLPGFDNRARSRKDGLVECTPEQFGRITGSDTPVSGGRLGITQNGARLMHEHPDGSIDVYNADSGRHLFRCCRFAFSTEWLTHNIADNSWTGELRHLLLRDPLSGETRPLSPLALERRKFRQR